MPGFLYKNLFLYKKTPAKFLYIFADIVVFFGFLCYNLYMREVFTIKNLYYKGNEDEE